MPEVLRVDPLHPEPAVIAAAAAVLRRGGLVAMPTETVYGLAARGLHGAEVARIFVAKGRPQQHPLILHVDGEAMARALVAEWSARAERFARAFWPGPLTLVLPKAPCVPDEVTGGLATVGLRAPAHAVARALVAAVGEPLAAPSANAHLHVSPTQAAHVVASLGDAVDLVLDAGPCAHGIESTVLDLAHGAPRVLRPGAVTLDALRAVDADVAYEALVAADDAPRASPGMASRHYSPRAPLALAPQGAAVADALAGVGGRVAVIVWSDEARAALSGRGAIDLVVLPAEPEGYARGLYAALHDADAGGAAAIVVERVPDGPAWWAVADRLSRAAAR